jgi:hypothetical protein
MLLSPLLPTASYKLLNTHKLLLNDSEIQGETIFFPQIKMSPKPI